MSNRIWRTALAALLSFLGLADGAAAHANEVIVYGYLPYWEYEPAEAPWEELTHIAIFSVGMASDGTLTQESRWTGRAEEAVRLGAEHDVKVHLCVTNFNDAQQYAVLSDPARRAAVIERLAGLVDAYGADGVNVDFEGVGARSRDLLVTFVEELKEEVDEVFLAAPFVDWSDAWDYGRLTSVSDGLFIMGYEAHGSWGDAGPNVPLFESGRWGFVALDWAINDYRSAGADLSKVIIGLPTYGHAWQVADATVVPPSTSSYDRVLWYRNGDIARYGRRFDEASSSTYFSEDGRIQGWIDDAGALLAKLEWVVEESGAGGVGFWALGYDDNDPLVWDYLGSLNEDGPDPPAAGFAGELVGVSQGGTIHLTAGDAVELWVDVRNIGTEAWTPETTRLAPLPRDAGSPLSDDSWLSTSRVTGVAAVTPPEAVGRFQFVIRTPGAGTYELRLGLVEEGTTWFADAGGPADGFVTFPVEVSPAEADPAFDVGSPDAGGPDAGVDEVGPWADADPVADADPDSERDPEPGPDVDASEVPGPPGLFAGESDAPVTIRGCVVARPSWPSSVLVLLFLLARPRQRRYPRTGDAGAIARSDRLFSGVEPR